MKRPDLNGINPEIIEYIYSLENELERLKSKKIARERREANENEDEDLASIEIFEQSEPPSSQNVITITKAGVAKRTPRHLYNLQKRGGMGIFDINTSEDDPPVSIVIADPNQTLLLITSHGRGFHIPVSGIPEGPIHSGGLLVTSKINLPPDETVSAVVPVQAEGFLALLGQNGMVRLLRHHVFGDYMKPGINLYEHKVFGMLADACWTTGDADLFIGARSGKAIRFSEKLVPPQGTLGIRLSDSDCAVTIASVHADANIFILGADGRGTVRSMESFTANKSPGSGGKICMNSDHVVKAVSVESDDHIFVISRLSKIIRFRIRDVPIKDAAVQGVICMSLRSDDPVDLISYRV